MRKKNHYPGVKNRTRINPELKLLFRFREHCRGCEFIRNCSLAYTSTEEHNGEAKAEYINKKIESLEKAFVYKMEPIWKIDYYK